MTVAISPRSASKTSSACWPTRPSPTPAICLQHSPQPVTSGLQRIRIPPPVSTSPLRRMNSASSPSSRWSADTTNIFRYRRLPAGSCTLALPRQPAHLLPHLAHCIPFTGGFSAILLLQRRGRRRRHRLGHHRSPQLGIAAAYYLRLALVCAQRPSAGQTAPPSPSSALRCSSVAAGRCRHARARHHTRPMAMPPNRPPTLCKLLHTGEVPVVPLQFPQ